MNKHQQYLLKLLGEIHELCRANGIDYSIACGTMIGAVRNRGFLPWDDDADIFMTYDNYCKFKEVCAEQLPENRFLGTPDTQECYGHLLPRYISRDTTSFHTAQSLTDDVAGEVIDIFVLDPIADGEGVYEAYLQDLGLYTTLANYANVAAYRYETDPELYAAYNERMKTEGRLAIMQECEAKLASHFDDAGSRFVFRWQGAPVIFQRSWFDSYTEVQFEGTTVMSSAHMNECLTCYYGEEWMEVPRVINASKHNAAGSLNFPYTEALEFYRPTYDRAELLRETERRRYLVLKNAPASNRLANDQARVRAYVAAVETQQRIDDDPAEFARALEQRDIPALKRFLDQCVDTQCGPKTIGRHADKYMYRYLHPIVLPVSDEALEGVLYILMAAERIRHASRLLVILNEQGRGNSQGIETIRATIMRLRESMNAYQDGDFDRAYKLAASCYERYPFAPGFRKMACAAAAAAFSANPTDDTRERLLDEVAFGRAAWPEDGVFAKYEADLLKAAGREEDARDLYMRAAESTRNGLILRDIHEDTGYWPTWMRKPAWARAYGIKRQKALAAEPLVREHADGADGATPAPAPAPATEDSDIGLYLFELLRELCALCDKEHIPYVLHPATVQALCRQGVLSESPKNTGIVVSPQDAAKIAKLSLKRQAKNRAIVIAGSRPDIEGASLRYHGLDSLYVNLRSGKTLPPNSLYVNIWPLEAKHYPEDDAARLRSWYARYRSLYRRQMSARREVGSNLVKTLEYPARSIRNASKLKACKQEGVDVYSQMMKHSASLKKLFVHSGQKPWACDAAVLDDADTVEVRGVSMRVPHDIDRWLARAGQQEVAADLEGKAVASTHITYEQLVAEGAFDETYFKRNHEAAIAAEDSAEILERFRLNFDQIKLAVQLKELSLSLMPRKDEILALEAAGDWETLGPIMRPYVRCAKAYGHAGEPRFDDDLFRVLQEALKR